MFATDRQQNGCQNSKSLSQNNNNSNYNKWQHLWLGKSLPGAHHCGMSRGHFCYTVRKARGVYWQRRKTQKSISPAFAGLNGWNLARARLKIDPRMFLCERAFCCRLHPMRIFLLVVLWLSAGQTNFSLVITVSLCRGCRNDRQIVV